MIGVGVSPFRSRQQLWWPTGATFYADFANMRYMKNGLEVSNSNAFSFTRASTKLALDADGHWHNFATDIAAITNKGQSLESAETYHPTNSSFSGANIGSIGAGGAIPTGWYAGSWTSIEIISLTNIDGLDVIVLDLTLDNTSGGSAVGGSIEFCNVEALFGEHWTVGGQFELMQTFGDDTCTAPENILQIQERNSSNGFLNNLGGIINNLDMSSLSDRVAKTKPISDITAGRIAAFYSWNNVLPGEFFHRRCAICMPFATKGTTVSSPLPTSNAGTQVRAQDAMTLLLPTQPQHLTVQYDDNSTVEFLSVSGETALPLNAEKAIRSASATPI